MLVSFSYFVIVKSPLLTSVNELSDLLVTLSVQYLGRRGAGMLDNTKSIARIPRSRFSFTNCCRWRKNIMEGLFEQGTKGHILVYCMYLAIMNLKF